jgi:hypothetical protein
VHAVGKLAGAIGGGAPIACDGVSVEVDDCTEQPISRR